MTQFGGGKGIKSYFPPKHKSNQIKSNRIKSQISACRSNMKLPIFEKYNKQIISFKDTKLAFPDFKWRQWIQPFDKNHKHEDTDAYMCITKVGDLCKDKFSNRTTKRILTKAKHHRKHKGKPKDVYKRVTKFLYVEKRDTNNVLWVCYIGEIDLRESAVKKRNNDPSHWAIGGFLNVIRKDKNNDSIADNSVENVMDENNENNANNDPKQQYVTKEQMEKYCNSIILQQKQTTTKSLKQSTLHSYSTSSPSPNISKENEVDSLEHLLSIFYGNEKLKVLSESFKQQPLSKYNLESLYGLTPAQIFQHEYMRNKLIVTVIKESDILKLQNGSKKMRNKQPIKFNPKDVTVHCSQCAQYYQCTTTSATQYCCPDHQRRNNVFIKQSDLNSVDAGEILVDDLAIHCKRDHHLSYEAKYYTHDTINRTLTYCQVTKALMVILQNTTDKTFEIIQAIDEEFGIVGNKNNSRKRMKVIRKVLDQSVTFNTIRYINTPSEPDRSFDVRFNTLHADTNSVKSNKGEMVDIVTRTLSEQVALILGWPKHVYSSKHTVFTLLDKARIIAQCMKRCGALPTPLEGMSLNGKITLIIYSLVAGDTKYDDIIRWINMALAEIDAKCKIYKSLTGKEIVDDNHVLENAFKYAKIGHKLSVEVSQINRAATAYASGPKCTSIKLNSEMSVSYSASPEHRYGTHYVKMIKPFILNYKTTIELFQYCEWEKLEALTSAQFVLQNMTSMDWMNPGMTLAINTYQRSGSYAGGTFIVDNVCHTDIFPKIKDSKQKLLFTIKHFINNQNLMIWKEFANSIQDVLPNISAHVFDIIKYGKYDDVRIYFSEEISDMKNRNWKRYKNINHKRVNIKQQSQQRSLNKNVTQFVDKINKLNNTEYEFCYKDCYNKDGILIESLFDEKFDEYLQQIENEQFDPEQFKDFANFEYKEDASDEEDLAANINIYFEHLDATQPPFPMPVIMNKCSKVQYNRGILAAKYMLDSLEVATKYDENHYVKLKKWDIYKEQEDAVMSLLYLPLFIDTICVQLNELKHNQALRTQLIQQGTDRITKLYATYQNKNATKATRILFEVTPTIFLQQIRTVKSWIINFLIYNKNTAIQLKSQILRIFLSNIKLDKYYDLFIREGFGVHLSMLYDLTTDRLKSIGITQTEDRNSMLKHIHLAKMKDNKSFQNKSGVALRILFSEYKHESEYKQYSQICRQVERRAKDATWATNYGFWQFWEFEQSKVRSSSMACEAIGNLTGQYGSRKVGKSLNHDEIERNVKIKGSLRATKMNRRILCEGCSDYLVDTGSGVLKSTVERNKKRQKFPDIGKVLLRVNEKIEIRKFHCPMIVNSIQIRGNLHQINVSKHLLSGGDINIEYNVERNNDNITNQDVRINQDINVLISDHIDDMHMYKDTDEFEVKKAIDFEDIEMNDRSPEFEDATQALTSMVNDIILYEDVTTYMQNIRIEINHMVLFHKLKDGCINVENVEESVLILFYKRNELLDYITGRIAVIINDSFVRDILLFPNNTNSVDVEDVDMLKRHVQDMIDKRIYAKSNVFSVQEELLQPMEVVHFEERNNEEFIPISMDEIFESLTNTIRNNTILLPHEKNLILSNKPTKLHQYETVLLIKEYLVNNTTILRWFGNGMSDCSKATANFILFLSPEFFIDIENKNDLIESKILLILLRLFIICCEY
eukprot:339377_1